MTGEASEASKAAAAAQVAQAVGTPQLAERRALQERLEGYRGTAALCVAARLGIADLLANGPRTAEDLARATACDAGALRRLLRGLAVLGVVVERADGALALAPAGEWLRSDHPLSLRPLAILTGEEFLPSWGALLHSVRTGETAFPHVFGMSNWEHRAQNPELNTCFNQFMVQQTQVTASDAAVVGAYDFAAARTVCDVAGGLGALLAAVLAAHPAARGLLFDQAHVVAEAAASLQAAGVAERCTLIAGDMFAPYPPELRGLDVYLLKNIIHDWDDERSVAILARCREAMGAASRLLLVERLLPARSTDDPMTVWLDLLMLAVTGGRQRSAEEYRGLFAAAGLVPARVLPTASGFSLVEALAGP